MSLPMATLGYFVFLLSTVPYQSEARSTRIKWAQNERVGRRASHQFLGPGDDTLTLSGTLLPSLTGGRLSLAVLRTMAESGNAHDLIMADGSCLGLFIIENLEETATEFSLGGAPKKIEFTLGLKRVEDEVGDWMGEIGDFWDLLF